MRTTFACLLGCVLACTSGDPKPEPTKAEQPSPAIANDSLGRARPEIAEPVSAAEAIPTATPSPEPRAPVVRDAGVPAPEGKDILALARAAGLEAPASATKPEPFGPRRYVAIVRTRTGKEPARFGLHALVLSLPEAEGAAWAIADRIELLEWTREWLDDADAGSIPTTIYVDDYEDDGELELLVRFRNEIMCPGGGANEVTTLMLIELAETPPRIALQTEIDHALGSGAAQTKAKLIHEDLDGDTHRDLKIVYRSSELDEDGAPTQADGEEERRWRWDPQADGWVRLAAEGKWVEYARGEGCEW